MRADTQAQIKEFSTALADSLPVIDEADIRQGADPWTATRYGVTPSSAASVPRRRRGPLVASAAGLLVVLVMAIPLLFVDSRSTMGPVSGSGPSGLGIDGTHFSLDDMSWTLSEAWAEADDLDSTFSLYDRGDQHVSILTGSMADTAMTRGDPRTDSFLIGETEVIEYRSPGGIHYTWLTNEGLRVVVNFAHMSHDEARHAGASLRPIDAGAWAASITPSDATEVRAHTGMFGVGGEEGYGELIRVDAPEAASVVLEMGEGIQLPPGGGFDLFLDNLPSEPTVMTTDAIVGILEFSAVCSWTGYWLDAFASGDIDARTEALAVLEEIPSWPALNASDGGGVIDAMIRNAQLAAAGDAQGVRDNLYTRNCTGAATWD